MTDPANKPTVCAQPDVFYPIVPDLDWLSLLVPLGVRTIQLRMKNMEAVERQRQIGAALALCADHNCQLIVNDHWRDAIELGADYIHLGQEDLATCDLTAVKAAGLKMGISTHSLAELQIALSVQPDYIALGPVYETKLKKMAWAPQGLELVSVWKQQIGDLPLVGIGGITPTRAPQVLQAGANSVAVITDFYSHQDPAARIANWLAWASHQRS